MIGTSPARLQVPDGPDVAATVARAWSAATYGVALGVGSNEAVGAGVAPGSIDELG
jgi:hypothetical protein